MILNVKGNGAVDGSGVCSLMDDSSRAGSKVDERVLPPQCPETGKQRKEERTCK